MDLLLALTRRQWATEGSLGREFKRSQTLVEDALWLLVRRNLVEWFGAEDSLSKPMRYRATMRGLNVVRRHLAQRPQSLLGVA
jgi:hypothetical protein